jgi:hypothetical protein
MNLYAAAPGATRATPVTAALDPQLGCGDFSNSVFGVTQPCAATFYSNVSALNTDWLLTARADYDLSSRDHVYLRLNTDHSLAVGADPINAVFNSDYTVLSYGGQLGYARIISPRSVNTLLLSAAYISTLAGPPSLSAALNTFPTTINFNLGLFNGLGGNDASWPSGNKNRQWQLVDDYSLIRGEHNLRAGVSVRKSFVSTYFYGALTSGRLTFNSITDFVDGSLTNGSNYAQAFATVGAEDVNFYTAGFYAQDEWRARPNLMVTLALRFDRNSNLHCPSGCFTELTGQGSFDTITHSADIPYNQSIRTGLTNALGNVDPIIPEPRLGFAYSLDKATVLRGGAGIFADANPGLLADRFITNAPAVAIFTTTSGLVATGSPQSIFATVAESAAALQQGFANGDTLAQLRAQVPLDFNPPNFFTISRPVHTPKYYEWNVELQRAFGAKYLLSVNYVGNHGYHELIQTVSGNGYSKAGYAGLPTSAPDPRFGEIISLNNQGWSNYDGLVSSFKWRMNGEFSGQLSYTWSHSLDTCSNDCVPEPFSVTDYRFQFNPLNLASLNYSNSDYDVRQSLSASYIYQVPTGRLRNRVVKSLAGGWRASGTVFFHTSYPFTILDTAVIKNFTNFSGKVSQPIIADFVGSTYPTCTTPNVSCYSGSLFVSPQNQHDFGNIPRNSFRGPGYFDTDLNLNRTFAVAERYHFLIGASFFNVLNHPNFLPPVNNVASGEFGQILSTASPPTSAYGSFAGSAVTGRVVQTVIKFVF